MRTKLQSIVESRGFETFITAVIVINAIGLGLETSPAVMNAAGDVIRQLDKIAIAIFVVELLLKLFVYRLSFFRNGWNVFDLAIVSAALVPAGEQYSVLRALRILRALRLVSVVPSMRKVIVGLFSAIPSIGTVIIMLVLLFYISAVMATKLFGGEFPQWFGSMGASLYSLFQIMTLESWSMGIVRPVMEEFPYAWAFFLPFILITTFAVANLVVGLIVNSMQDVVEEDESAADERHEILDALRAMNRRLATIEERLERRE